MGIIESILLLCLAGGGVGYGVREHFAASAQREAIAEQAEQLDASQRSMMAATLELSKTDQRVEDLRRKTRQEITAMESNIQIMRAAMAREMAQLREQAREIMARHPDDELCAQHLATLEIYAQAYGASAAREVAIWSLEIARTRAAEAKGARQALEASSAKMAELERQAHSERQAQLAREAALSSSLESNGAILKRGELIIASWKYRTLYAVAGIIAVACLCALILFIVYRRLRDQSILAAKSRQAWRLFFKNGPEGNQQAAGILKGIGIVDKIWHAEHQSELPAELRK